MEARGETASASNRPACTPRTKARSLAPFLSKTYELVEGSKAPDVVSWNEEGTGFVVWLPQEFSKCVLPMYFKHCNFASFIRQLNTYQGFKKSASDRWEFRHEKFQKGRRYLLAEITRRKCEPSVFPTFLKACEKCPPPIENDLLEENKVLQQKNAELLSQIKHYKVLEAELLKCLSQYVR
ncbi:heat stress transcription factor B-4b-like [Cocos nucifera]|uniref:Heat stress transcription factor B-4b-like n=1 Tax=Cocos nucifera TaxID=13894 RepID=A0A8K0N5F6_COCNU|nr:heat stress transcription factor B-4b-like [Cocos nucifera]